MKLIRLSALELKVKLCSIKLARNKYAGESVSNYHKAVLQVSEPVTFTSKYFYIVFY